jgi:hypothetical protein
MPLRESTRSGRRVRRIAAPRSDDAPRAGVTTAFNARRDRPPHGPRTSHSIRRPFHPHSHGLRPHAERLRPQSLRLRPRAERLYPHSHGLRPRPPRASVLTGICARMFPGSVHTRSISVHEWGDSVRTRPASVRKWRESGHTRTVIVRMRTDSVHMQSDSVHTLRGLRCGLPHPRRCSEARCECSEIPF